MYYPECPGTHPIKSQHRFLAESLSKLNVPFPEHVPEWAYIKEKISTATKDKVLISEEVFWHLFEQRKEEKLTVIEWIRRQLEGHNVKVVCYLRRQDKWIESWYNQIVKTDVNSNSRLDYLDFINTFRDYGLLDYPGALSPWARVFGKDNLIVRPFEKKTFLGGDIIADFLGILNISLDEAAVRPKNRQVSLCNTACELSSIYNKTPRAAEFKQKFLSVVMAFDAESKDRRRFTTQELALRMLAEYDMSNRMLANEYGQNGAKFFDQNLSGYEDGEFPGLSAQELASFMMYLFQDMQGQIRGLRKRVSELEEKATGESA